MEEDLIMAFPMSENRLCIDGTNPNGREIIDYWFDMECPYCRIDEVLLAQKSIENICIVARHSPTLSASSMAKALEFENQLQNGSDNQNVEKDALFAEGKILYTPTFVIEGIRFTACDFTEKQLQEVNPIAERARKNDINAKK